MRLFEPDGGEADMCGNGIRCIGAYLIRKLGKSEVDVLTRDGIKHISCAGSEYTVQMGKVRINRQSAREYLTDKGDDSDTLLDLRVQIGSRATRGSLVNAGVPHIVFMIDDAAVEDVKRIGEAINQDRARFPKGMNVDFAQILGPHEISIRTYERGVYDETMACGTGATASAAAATLQGLVKPGSVKVTTRGGIINIKIDKELNAQMTGPVAAVYSGELTTDI